MVVELVQFVVHSNAKKVRGANRTKYFAEFISIEHSSAAASVCDSTHDSAPYMSTGGMSVL